MGTVLGSIDGNADSVYSEQRMCVCVCAQDASWKDAGDAGLRDTRFLTSDKDAAPCLRVIASEREWPLHHPACGGIHLRK